MSPPVYSALPKKSRLFGIEPKAARVTWTAALTLVFLGGIYAIRSTLIVFAVALLFAYLVYPLLDRISSRFSKRNQPIALGLTYLLVIGALAAVAIAIGSQVVSQARQLISHPPDLKGFLEQLKTAHPVLTPMVETVQGRVKQQLGDSASAVPSLGLRALAASMNLLYLIVIPILSFFMLKDGERICRSFLATFTAGSGRAEGERILSAIHSLLLSYMRSLLLLCWIVN